ncbi:unnamed protein product, partial [Amoebophrya sp. A25]|eukprot:GSA25T00012622001.1
MNWCLGRNGIESFARIFSNWSICGLSTLTVRATSGPTSIFDGSGCSTTLRGYTTFKMHTKR